jgi:transcriptional regulator with XRE-family HTH domain
MGAPQRADWREERRKRAWALKQRSWLQKDIAAALGVSAGAVSQWLKRQTVRSRDLSFSIHRRPAASLHLVPRNEEDDGERYGEREVPLGHWQPLGADRKIRTQIGNPDIRQGRETLAQDDAHGTQQRRNADPPPTSPDGCAD